jgi:hypothetical protein
MKTYPGRDRAKDLHKLAGVWVAIVTGDPWDVDLAEPFGDSSPTEGIARAIGLRYTDRTPEGKRSLIRAYCERLLEDVPRYVRRQWKKGADGR